MVSSNRKRIATIHGSVRRRAFCGVAVGAFAGLTNLSCSSTAGSSASSEASAQLEQPFGFRAAARWVGTWSASPLAWDQSFFEPSTTFDNQTLRQIARVSKGGTKLRVQISNAFGDTELAIGAAHIAWQSHGASIVPWSDRALRFDGEQTVSIPAGQEVVSDPVDLLVFANSNLAVTLHLPEQTGLATWHEIGRQTAFISPPGNFVDAPDMPSSSTTTARYFVTGIDVRAEHRAFSVVALGDSITDGFNSTVDANHRYPDFLSERLNRGWLGRVGVLNQGISGNRVLFDFMGTNASDRFERDVLSVSGVKYVILMMGINDIGFPGAFPFLPPDQQVPASDIIEGLAGLVTRAHAQDLVVYAGTLTPFAGTTLPGYYSPEGEAKRQAINEWIRTSGTFDAVIDFDAVLRDPEQPTRLLPEFDSGDHLHPSDAGYQAMADAIDLGLFLPHAW